MMDFHYHHEDMLGDFIIWANISSLNESQKPINVEFCPAYSISTTSSLPALVCNLCTSQFVLFSNVLVRPRRPAAARDLFKLRDVIIRIYFDVLTYLATDSKSIYRYYQTYLYLVLEHKAVDHQHKCCILFGSQNCMSRASSKRILRRTSLNELLRW